MATRETINRITDILEEAVSDVCGVAANRDKRGDHEAQVKQILESHDQKSKDK
jgi:hypothetical protein